MIHRIPLHLLLCLVCLLLCTRVGIAQPRNETLENKSILNPASRLEKFKDKSNHEAKSSSSLGSLYMNIATDDSQVQYGQAQLPPGTGPSLVSYDGTHGVALGAEDQQQQQSQGLGQTVLVAEANQISPNELQSYGIYNHQPLAMMPSGNTQVNSPHQSQVLASIYIDQFGNQQLRVPQGARVSQMGADATPDNAGSINNGFYSYPHQTYEPSLQQSASLYTNRAFSNQPSSLEAQQYDSTGYSHGYKTVPERKTKLQEAPVHFDSPRFSNQLSLKPTRTNESLSNAQLMSLIDELKDFNSKQATVNLKQQQRLANAKEQQDQRADEIQSDDDEIDEDPSTVDTKHSSASEPAKTSEHQDRRQKSLKAQDNGDKVSADDLAKFAKFLMTKEGANMRFQLGLDKEAPDDGDLDDDDKDALLESKHKSSRYKGVGKIREKDPKSIRDSSQDLNDLDKKHSEVANQMDVLLENLTGTLNKAAKEEEEERRRRRKDRRKSMDMDGDDLKARARRNSGDKWKNQRSEKPLTSHTITKNNFDERPTRPQTIKHERGHKRNLAKRLIQQDLLQDKLESNIQSIRESERAANSVMRPKIEKSSTTTNGQKKRRDIDTAELSGGEENEEYPRKARKRDHIELLHELQRARQDRSRARSEPSKVLNKEPIVKQALAGQLGLQTASHPDGKLTVTSGRGASITVKLPERGGRVVHADYDNDAPDHHGDQSSRAGLADGATDGRLKHVRIESDQPLKDEYPISERVSSRLDVLSSNLDRYFNDGFMNEIENRAKIKSGRPNGGEEQRTKSDHQQAESSTNHVNETSAVAAARGAGDRDFDVNVGVDGKRDAPEKDDDDDYEEDEDASKQSAANDRDKPDGETKDQKRRDTSVITKRTKRTGKRMMNPSGNKQTNQPQTRTLDENEQRDGSLKQRLSAGEKHLSYEGRGDKPTSRPDPVEGESFDTPIGPDNENLELLLPPAADKKVESSRESKQVMTRNGKRVTPKFYEEPDW